MLETAGEFGGALGIAVLGSIGAALYRNHVATPAGLSTAAVTAAHQTLAEATVVAGGLPALAGPALLHSAREAFTTGMHGVVVTAAVVMVAAAGGCVLRLRGSSLRQESRSHV